MKTLAVLLPTYNAAKFLNVAIDSILNQTYSDFQLYIFDDFSTDNTEDIVNSYLDIRITYIKNEKNLGISKTLNKGLDMLAPNYEFIARMDADDFAYSNRLTEQMLFLNSNPEIQFCGTQGYWVKDINEFPESNWMYPVSHLEIKYHLLFSSCFGHSSVMFKSKFFLNNSFRYNINIRTCEDWELWTRMISYGKLANLEEFLMKYRIVSESNHRSIKNKNIHLKEKSKVIAKYWGEFGLNCNWEFIYNNYFNEESRNKNEFLKDLKKLIKMSNELVKIAKVELKNNQLSKLKYRLLRNIKRAWLNSQISFFDIKIWYEVLTGVRFNNIFSTFIIVFK